MGAGIGLGVALSLKKEGVAVVTLMAAGMAGTLIFSFSKGEFELTKDPLSAYVCTLFALFGLSLLKRKTPVDMILVSLLGLAFAILTCLFIGYVVKISFISDEVESEGNAFMFKRPFEYMIKYLCPLCLAAILIFGTLDMFGIFSVY